jgi:hypothetical protein
VEVEGHRVWDYAADKFLHRTLQSVDGGVLDVSKSAPTAHDDDDEVDRAVLESRKDAIADFYHGLLEAQLEAQRTHFADYVTCRRSDNIARTEASERLGIISAYATGFHALIAQSNVAWQQWLSQMREAATKLNDSLQFTRLTLSSTKDGIDKCEALIENARRSHQYDAKRREIANLEKELQALFIDNQ